VRQITTVCTFLVFLAGCSAYKELSPKPEVLPQERGFIELKNGDEFFTLDKDGMYFIKFPAPAADNSVLVLTLNNKPIIGSHLTSVFDDGDTPQMRIRDEAAGSDTLSVYAIDTKVLTFFWVIDTVRADTRLVMHYRYAPRWRYMFETRYAVLQSTLRENVIDRRIYESIGAEFNFDSFNFSREREAIDARTSNLVPVRDELVKIGSLFPQEVINRRDTAYQQYTALKSSVDDELRFQEDYASTLRFFEREQSSRGNTPAFVESAPVFADFLAHSDRYRRAVADRARELILARLPEIPPFYENQIRNKDNAKRIALRPPLDGVKKLYNACGLPFPDDLRTLEPFVERFNLEAGALQAANNRLSEADKMIQNNPAWLSDTFYAGLMGKMDEANSVLVDSQLGRFERQRGYPCVTMLLQETAAARAKAAALRGVYSRAKDAVTRLNASAWSEAETSLRDLYATIEFNAIPAVKAQRNDIVAHLESELYSRVKKETETRVDAFIAKDRMTIDNVPGLYQDSVFLPIYQFSFSSAGPATVQQRNKQISDYLFQARHLRFPETAIKALYQDFVRSIANRGAEKARAIVEHGKEYQGTDKDVKAYLAECDPTVAKWIVRAKEYRKVYTLPVTNNRQGANEYLLRLRLNIPSDAQFPVFDITVKLPQEIAARAGSAQWYEEITINKKPIKNEGRFRITAPKADNNYESLITPVQMDKEGNNILEIRFKYPGYRAFEISAMAQVPIIRKN
jgi:hypothetical protein